MENRHSAVLAHTCIWPPRRDSGYSTWNYATGVGKVCDVSEVWDATQQSLTVGQHYGEARWACGYALILTARTLVLAGGGTKIYGYA